MFSKTRSKAKSGDNPDEGEGATEQPASRRRKPAALLDTDEFIMFDSLVSGMLLSLKQLLKNNKYLLIYHLLS